MIGLAGRFPGARSVADFWRNLLAGEDSRRELLEKPEWFDAEFFGISPGDAEAMDPQHRVFLEECWAALEDAACDPAKFAGAIGVFGGCSRRTYPVENGNDADEFASRVAARLNLRGPAVTVQTACSTSLAAVCQAVQSLRCYGCDMALAGGASIVFPQAAGGVGVVALKRLSDAVETGDFIYAVIQAATLNHDGATPSASSHAEVIAAAHTLAGISAESVTFIEADAAELDALTRAFRTTTAEKNFCALGSVKTNLGNVGAAAGIAGLIKTALALRYETIPASLDRPHSQTTETPFFHIGHRMEWPTGETPRRAGVCSFGIGGTNAHIVLEEPPRRIAAETGRAENLLILSGKSESTLAQRASDLADWIEARPEFSLADIAHTLVAGRRHFEHRRAVVAATLAPLVLACAPSLRCANSIRSAPSPGKRKRNEWRSFSPDTARSSSGWGPSFMNTSRCSAIRWMKSAPSSSRTSEGTCARSSTPPMRTARRPHACWARRAIPSPRFLP